MNFFEIAVFEKSVTQGWTDGQTDRQTDPRTDRPSYRVVCVTNK